MPTPPTSRRCGSRPCRGDELWFAYKFSVVAAQEAAAASLRRVVDLPWTADRIRMTTGGFGAIALAMKSVADPGDEVVYSLPPWFFYEALALEAGLVPVEVRWTPRPSTSTWTPSSAAITARTRVVIVNSPNNPTGRIYPEATLRALAELLDAASERNGRPDVPHLRRALQPDRLRRRAVPQPGGVLPAYAALLLLRQDAAHPRPAARLPGAAPDAAGRGRAA